jgi:predicted ATP-grasp superfamily ATP-dependent carboligase
MSVLVTDGNERAALAVTRALGRKQIDVLVGSETERSLAGSSRYCRRAFRYPSPYEDPKGYLDVLLQMVTNQQVEMLVPISDLAMHLIGERKAQFDAHTRVAAPAPTVHETLSDKYRLMRLAQQLDVPIPDTLFVEEGRVPQDLRSVGEFPLIVKPGRSRMLIDGAWTNTGVRQVMNREELEQVYRQTPYLKWPSLIQRRIEGEGQGIFALCDHGRPLALFAHRRLREKPPAGGVSVLRESIELPKPMADCAMRLLHHVGWHGVAMVEFKVEGQTGIPRLMEINGRFWGSLQLACDAGLDFPFLLYQLICGRAVEVPAAGYRAGVKSRWLLGDLDHLLARLFKSDEALRLPPGCPSRARCVMEFLRFFQKDLHYEVERWDDIGPVGHEMCAYVRAMVKGHA